MARVIGDSAATIARMTRVSGPRTGIHEGGAISLVLSGKVARAAGGAGLTAALNIRRPRLAAS